MPPTRWITTISAAISLLCAAPAPAQTLPDRLRAAEQRGEELLAEVRAMREARQEPWTWTARHVDPAFAAVLNPLLAESGCRIVSDQRNQVKLTGPPRKLPAIKRGILTLEIERSEHAKNTRVFAIQHGNPRDVVSVFGMTPPKGAPSPKFEVLGDIQAKAVIVRAPPDDMEAFERIIAAVDAALANGGPVVQFDLKHVRALAIAESLREVYGESECRITAHVPMNAVFVRTGDAELAEQIRRFIRMIDSVEAK